MPLLYAIFGVWIGLGIVMFGLLLVWRYRVRQGTMDSTVRARFVRRYEVLAKAIRYYPLLLLALFVVLGVIGALMKR
jgi:hypothetical protein